jgi:hypothetical protein
MPWISARHDPYGSCPRNGRNGCAETPDGSQRAFHRLADRGEPCPYGRHPFLSGMGSAQGTGQGQAPSANTALKRYEGRISVDDCSIKGVYLIIWIFARILEEKCDRLKKTNIVIIDEVF